MSNSVMLVAAARKSARATHASSSLKSADCQRLTSSMVVTLGLVLSAFSNTVVEAPLKEFNSKVILVRQVDVAMI